jgi:phosphatidylglycerol:prolipoprotein diacylglycerol transferase
VALAVLTYPSINPIAFHLGPLVVRWYGLAYVAGFIGAALILRRLNRVWEIGISDDHQIDIVLAAIIGVIVGGRLGYVLFYGGSEYITHPLRVFATWDGGMSFHGGLAGILLAGWFVSRRIGVPYLQLVDLGAVGAPIGFLLGRITNFVNGELWGRVTTVPWGMVFPTGGPLPRHPSQLYEAFLEGLVLFVVLLWLARRKRADGMIFGTLLAGYAAFRILVEFVREPDLQLGFIAGPFTMGQLLSLPMLLVGVWVVVRAVKAERASRAASTPDEVGE